MRVLINAQLLCHDGLGVSSKKDGSVCVWRLVINFKQLISLIVSKKGVVARESVVARHLSYDVWIVVNDLMACKWGRDAGWECVGAVSVEFIVTARPPFRI